MTRFPSVPFTMASRTLLLRSVAIKRTILGLFFTACITTAPSALGALILRYEFETTSGTHPDITTPDSSGLNNTGALGGGDTPGVNYPAISVGNGPNGSNSMQFFGGAAGPTANSVSVLDGDPDFDTTYTEFTFAAWLNPAFASSDTTSTWIAGKIGSANQRGWQIFRELGTDSVKFNYYQSSAETPSRTITVAGILTENTWTHFAVVFKANEFVNIYVDSVEVVNQMSGVLSTLNGSNNVALQIGNRGSNLAGSWNGWMDDVRIYSHALSSAEIAELATIAPAVPGDFDGDGDVDGADFVVWQTNFPKAEGGTLDTGDADGDGDVDGADFVIWQTNFPFTPSPGVTPVPEPTTAWLCAAAVFLLGARDWRLGATARP